jgi:signal transduction histidine kinase
MRPGKTNGSAPVDRAWQFEATTGVEGAVTDAEGNRRNRTFGITPLGSDDGQPEHLLSVGHDPTPQERAEEAYQAEKRNAVSRLASGVAHDINNNLAVILGYAEFLLGKSGRLDRGSGAPWTPFRSRPKSAPRRSGGSNCLPGPSPGAPSPSSQ